MTNPESGLCRTAKPDGFGVFGDQRRRGADWKGDTRQMPKEQITDRITRFEQAWEKLADTTSFGGMTLSEFTEIVKPSFDERANIQVLEAQRSAAIRRRDDADELAREKMDLVVNAVRGNPDFGPDSPLYRALGFIPKSERRSGLTRKVKPAATTSEPLPKAA
jgi:hypothetical protein